MSTKSGQSQADKTRLVPITLEIRELLWPLRGHHETAVFTYVASRDLPKRKIVKGKRYPLTVSGLQARWHRDRVRSSVSDFRWHDIRHAAATRVLRETGNLRVVQKLLGHEKIGTTTRYAHAQIDDVADALERVANSRNNSRTDRIRLVSDRKREGSARS